MDAACGCPRFTGWGAAIATTCLGAAAIMTGLGASIFTCVFGTSGTFTSGSLIFGGSTLASIGLIFGGVIFGGLGRSGFFSVIGITSSVKRLLCSIVWRVAAAPSTTMTKAATQFTTTDVMVDALLCLPVSSRPKCVN